MKLPLVQLRPEPIDTGDLPREFMEPREIDALVHLVRSVNARTMIEVGVNIGRTARVLLDNVDTLTRYIGIDVEHGYRTSMPCQRNEVPKRPGYLAADDPRFELMVRPRGSLDLDRIHLPESDVFFIDGDHGAHSVWHDTRLARWSVKRGGLIIWHDYHDRDTVQVRDVLDSAYEWGSPIQHIDGTWLAYEVVGFPDEVDEYEPAPY